MNLKIIEESALTPEHIQDIYELYIVCNRHDRTAYTFDDEDDFREEGDINTFLLYEDDRLASSLTIFSPTKKEAEVTALTSPDKRKKGYFSSLLHRARKEIERRNIQSILFVCDAHSKDGTEVLSRIKARYEYSEFLMIYRQEGKRDFGKREEIRISPAETADKERLVEINRLAFDNGKDESREILEESYHSSKRVLYSIIFGNDVIGMIGVYDESARKYIYGFCIDSEHRGRGIGKYVLYETVKRLENEGKEIVLEVQTDNRNALSAYEAVGFAIEAEFRYCREANS